MPRPWLGRLEEAKQRRVAAGETVDLWNHDRDNVIPSLEVMVRLRVLLAISPTAALSAMEPVPLQGARRLPRETVQTTMQEAGCDPVALGHGFATG
jgi:hypothetical protein